MKDPISGIWSEAEAKAYADFMETVDRAIALEESPEYEKGSFGISHKTLIMVGGWLRHYMESEDD